MLRSISTTSKVFASRKTLNRYPSNTSLMVNVPKNIDILTTNISNTNLRLLNYKLVLSNERRAFHTSGKTENSKVSEIVSLFSSFPASVTIVALLGGTAMWIATRVKVAETGQYIVKTGPLVIDPTGISITKWTPLLPFQKYQFIYMQPENFSFRLFAMSSEMIEFELPGVFTIGPKDTPDDLRKYAKYIMTSSRPGESNEERRERHKTRIDKLIDGILAGDTRVLAASMTMESIFNGRKEFKDQIIQYIREQLHQFGMEIYNANIEELRDAEGSKFFENKRQKKLAEVENQAKVDISEAKKRGDVGSKEREVETRKRVAEFEKEAIEVENTNRERIAESNATLRVIQAESMRKENLARVEAEMKVKMVESVCGRINELVRRQLNLERMNYLKPMLIMKQWLDELKVKLNLSRYLQRQI